jgi:hypothetical protein
MWHPDYLAIQNGAMQLTLLGFPTVTRISAEPDNPLSSNSFFKLAYTLASTIIDLSTFAAKVAFANSLMTRGFAVYSVAKGAGLTIRGNDDRRLLCLGMSRARQTSRLTVSYLLLTFRRQTPSWQHCGIDKSSLMSCDS